MKTDVNEATFGSEAELTGPRGNPYKATVTKVSPSKWTIAGKQRVNSFNETIFGVIGTGNWRSVASYDRERGYVVSETIYQAQADDIVKIFSVRPFVKPYTV